MFLSITKMAFDFSMYAHLIRTFGVVCFKRFTSAVFTNLLLTLFCLMEISSINENWFDITGNNMLKRASEKIKKIRSAIQSTTEFVDETKQKNL